MFDWILGFASPATIISSLVVPFVIWALTRVAQYFGWKVDDHELDRWRTIAENRAAELVAAISDGRVTMTEIATLAVNLAKDAFAKNPDATKGKSISAMADTIRQEAAKMIVADPALPNSLAAKVAPTVARPSASAIADPIR